VPSFLDRYTEALAAATPAVIGFTTGAQQTVASLALARRLKACLPALRVVFGGANCQGEMARRCTEPFHGWMPSSAVRARGCCPGS
jgi:hypothetical protein